MCGPHGCRPVRPRRSTGGSNRISGGSDTGCWCGTGAPQRLPLSTAILARTNRVVLEMAAHLRANGVPYSRAGSSVYKLTPVARVLSLLRLALAEPCDGATLEEGLRLFEVDAAEAVAGRLLRDAAARDAAAAVRHAHNSTEPGAAAAAAAAAAQAAGGTSWAPSLRLSAVYTRVIAIIRAAAGQWNAPRRRARSALPGGGGEGAGCAG